MTPKPTEQEIKAFVGKKSAYYLEKWSSFLSNGESQSRFNVAAFWLAGLWISYRKMYKIAFMFWGIIIVETLFEYIVFCGILKYKEPPDSLSYIVAIASGVVCGGYGNRWYYTHMCENIAEVRRLNLSEESQIQILKKRGGTSWSAAIGFIAMFMVIFILVFGTIAILLGQS